MENNRKRYRHLIVLLFAMFYILLAQDVVYGAGTVTGLKQTYATGNSATVKWSKYSKAKYYDVYYGTTSTGKYKKINANNRELNYHFSELRQGRTYYVRVHAYSSDGTLLAKSSTLPIVTSPVVQMKNLKVSKTTTGSISVSWSKTSGASGYRVQCISENEESIVKSVTTTTTTFKSLSADTTYTILVVPYRKSSKGFLAYGWEAGDRLSDCTTALAVPAKLNVSTIYNMPGYLPQAKGYIEAGWTSVRGADGYECRLYDASAGKVLETKKVKSLRKVFKSVDNRVYVIKVRAYSKSGNTTKYSGWRTTYYSMGTSMEGYSCNQNNTKITSSWSKVPGATGYDVYVSFGDAKHYNKLRTVTDLSTTISWSDSKEDMIFIKIMAVRKVGSTTYRFAPKDVQYVGR